MMKISIIIPVFNTYKLLERLLLSIISKNLKGIDLEVIVVDDGSEYSIADKVYHLINVFSKEGADLVILYQQNTGPASARNTGLKHAKGEYIWFVDADDIIVNDCFQDFSRLIPFKILEFGYYDESLKKHFRPKIKRNYRTIEYLKMSDGRFYLWNKVFHRNTLVNTLFKEELMSLEDYCFCVSIFMKDYSIKFLSKEYYEYKLNSLSITKSISPDKKKQMAKDTRVVQDFLFSLKEQKINGYKAEIIDKLLTISVAGYIYSLHKHKYSKDDIGQAFDYYRSKNKIFFNPFYFFSYEKRRILLFVLFLNFLSIKSYIKRVF